MVEMTSSRHPWSAKSRSLIKETYRSPAFLALHRTNPWQYAVRYCGNHQCHLKSSLRRERSGREGDRNSSHQDILTAWVRDSPDRPSEVRWKKINLQ